MSNIIDQLNAEQMRQDIPAFSSGDTVIKSAPKLGEICKAVNARIIIILHLIFLIPSIRVCLSGSTAEISLRLLHR